MPKGFVCRCGTKYRRDPRIAVPCPVCRAIAGSPCTAPSGHRGGWKLHAPRRRLAFELQPCRCLDRWEKDQRRAGKKIPPRLTAAQAWRRFAPRLTPMEI